MTYRCLHDDVPHSRTLGRLTDASERLYMRILAVTDPWGRVTGDLDKLRLVAIPSLPWDDDKLHRAILELERSGAIDRYSTDDVWVIQVVNFDERQLVTKMKRAPSRFPNRTPSSLSANDLTLSLPLLDTVELGACDLGLSNTDLRASAEKSLQNPRSAERETEDREDRRESGLPTEVARTPAQGLSVAQTIEQSLETGTHRLLAVALDPDRSAELGDDPNSLASFSSQLRGADDGLVNVLADLRRKGLPPAAFAAALESVRERRTAAGKPQLQSEVRYFVGALKTMLREGTYRHEGAAA